MPSWKFQICLAILGLGGISVSIATPILFNSRGGHSPKSEEAKKYTWECYKWIIDRGQSSNKELGELAACIDKRNGVPLAPYSPIFVLWWLKDSGTTDYNTFTEVSQIKVERENIVSFTDKSGKSLGGDKKLKVQAKHLTNLNKLSGISLQDQCKLDLSGYPYKKLNCSSVGYTAEVEPIEWTFRLKE